MIHVPRPAGSEPAVLSRRDRNGKTETDRAIEYYTSGREVTEQFPFKLYKHDDVKDALEGLFKGKCAYCESRFGHVSPEDIEHWRPKGAVVLADGSESKPGYYWLAATWSNLLPSCIHCNRRQRQEDARDPANEHSGKQNLFPVADEGRRWTRHDQADRNGEEPLLLHPCEDDPARFLAVDAEAVVNEVHPAGTRENERARASIDVFGLNRSILVEERMKDRRQVLHLLHSVRMAVNTLSSPTAADPEREEAREFLTESLEMLKAERGGASEYLLLKQPLIDAFTAVVGPRLLALGFGN